MQGADAGDAFLANRVFLYLLREPHAIHSFELAEVREELESIHHCFTGDVPPAAIAPESPNHIVVPEYISVTVQEVFRFIRENRGRWACPSHRQVVEMYGGGDPFYDDGDQLLLDAIAAANARYRAEVNPNDRFVFLFRRFNGARELEIRDGAGRDVRIINISVPADRRENPQIVDIVQSLRSAFRGLIPVPDRFPEYSPNTLGETHSGLALEDSSVVRRLWRAFPPDSTLDDA